MINSVENSIIYFFIIQVTNIYIFFYLQIIIKRFWDIFFAK